MKQFLLLIFLIFIGLVRNASGQDTLREQKYDYYFNIGVSYIPFDYIGGPLIGLSYQHPTKKLGFNFHTNYLLEIGKETYINQYGNLSSGNSIKIINFKNLTYFELEYKLNRHKKLPIKAGLGYGWIYLGERNNIKSNRDHGYAVISPKIMVQYSWLTFQFRGNIPIKNNYFKSYYPFWRLFPGEISLVYRFKPQSH